MTDLNDKRQQFQERLDEIAERRKLTADSSDALQAWEAQLDARLAEFRGQSQPRGKQDQPAPSPRPAIPLKRPRPFSRSDAALLQWCQDADQMILSELELGSQPRPAGFQSGYQVVESEAAMKAAIARACGWEQAPADVVWKEYQLGVFHVPGQGTLINPAHYASQYGATGLNANDPRALAHVVSDVTMERWGWGFLLEYTALGAMAGGAGLWPAMLAYRARLPYADSRALELAQAIHRKWILLKTGWMDWVWQYVMFKAHAPVGQLLDRPRPGRMFELLMKIQNLFPLRIYPFGVKISLRGLVELVKYVLLEQAEIAPNVSQWAITQFQDWCIQHDPKVRELVNLPLSRILGRLYFSWLENQIGILSTPYAALIAAHEPQLDLASISAAEFLAYVEKEPRHSPDARLAMLSKLDARVKYNPRSMFTAAWERLKLEGPREFFA